MMKLPSSIFCLFLTLCSPLLSRFFFFISQLSVWLLPSERWEEKNIFVVRFILCWSWPWRGKCRYVHTFAHIHAKKRRSKYFAFHFFSASRWCDCIVNGFVDVPSANVTQIIFVSSFFFLSFYDHNFCTRNDLFYFWQDGLWLNNVCLNLFAFFDAVEQISLWDFHSIGEFEAFEIYFR